MLLTRPTVLPGSADAALRALGAGTVYIAGGPRSVSAGVQQQVEAMPGISTSRIAGANRYETAARVAETACASGWTTGPYIGVATGTNFPDAIGGGAVAGAMGGVLVLTRPAHLPGETRAFVRARGQADAPAIVFGGPTAVGETVLAELRAIPLL